MTDNEVICHFLTTRSKDFNEFISEIKTVDDSNVTLECVTTRLIAEERRKKDSRTEHENITNHSLWIQVIMKKMI